METSSGNTEVSAGTGVLWLGSARLARRAARRGRADNMRLDDRKLIVLRQEGKWG